MSYLPSRYSSRGLSKEESRKVLTTPSQTKKRGFEDAILYDADEVPMNLQPNDLGHDIEGDIQMVEVDNEQEVQVIADYVTDERLHHQPVHDSKPERSASSEAPIHRESYGNLTTQKKSTRQTYMVLDTNFILSHLSIVNSLAELHSKYHHIVVIPITVVKELDGLKESKKITNDDNLSGTTVGHLARWANNWIYKELAESSSAVRSQKLREFLDKDAIKDDAILDCCLYLKEKEDALVILLSNDKNLCMKALSNEILTVSYRKEMNALLIAEKAYEENQSRSGLQNNNLKGSQYQALSSQNQSSGSNHYNNSRRVVSNDLMDVQSRSNITPAPKPALKAPPFVERTRPVSDKQHLLHLDNFPDAANLVHKEVQSVVLNAIDHCMYEEYGEDMDMVGYDKSKVTRLVDSSNTLIRYWLSVFTEYFQRGTFKPFQSRGKKRPIFVNIPNHGAELVDFVEYWGDVLRALYIKRDDTQNSALEKILERWSHLAEQFKDEF